ncbi:LuxR C-terminal-related transcriptional regulator [Isoptericola sp. NPDC056573]|uniref:helix-turn-helix transcriptional regulator n=1 Tax=Isoptericola sp. NPDC056573 TaxID=3345868 RepID=UPI00367C5C58
MSRPTLFPADLTDEIVAYLTAGTSVDLLGQKGSGRSTLLDQITSALVEEGWDVVRVQGIATLADRPLEALAVADLARRAEQRGPSAVTLAVRRLEEALSDGRTVLVVDDVDDLDEASAGAVTAAHARRPFPVLTSTRPRPERVLDPFALPSEVRPGVQLTVPPVDYVTLHELVTRTLGGPVEPDVAGRVNALSGGLPGLAVAITEAAVRSGRLRLVDARWTAGPELWSPGLDRVVQPLVADLDRQGTEALQMLALAGTVEHTTAVELVGWEALEDLDACRLLQFTPHGDATVVGVYPALVEERYRHLPLGVRRLRFADRMAELLGPAEDDAADRPAAARTVWAPWFRSAARTPAADSAPGRATPDGLLPDTVLNRLMRDEWQHQHLLRRHEWERDRSPRTAVPYLRTLLVGNADLALMQAVVDGTPLTGTTAERAHFHRWHAQVLANAANDLDGAHALLDDTVGRVGPWDEPLEALADHLTLLFDRVPAPRSWQPTEDAAQTWQYFAALEAERLVAAGDPAAALALLAREGDWSDPDMIVTRQVLVGMARLLDGDTRGALAWSMEHLDRARTRLDADAVPGHAYVAVSALLLLGRVQELRSLLASVLAIGLTSSLQRHYTSSLLETAGSIARRDGLASTAETLTVQARTTAAGPSAFTLPTSTWITPRREVDASETDADHADRMWETVRDYLDRGFIISGAILAAATIDLAPSAERVEALRAAVGPTPASLVQTVVRVGEATVDDDVMAGARLGRALVEEGQISLGVRASAASVRRLRAAGRSADAAALMQEIRTGLDRAGVESDTLLGTALPTSTLTRRERQVGTLVARGLSNGEIARSLGVSGKTVENHINRLLHKLGVPDRTGVAAALHT